MRSITDWLYERHDYDGEAITNGQSLLVMSLYGLVVIGLAYLLVRQFIIWTRPKPPPSK